MPKILITGNGFDLYHHLPTKYGHFMSVMKTLEKYDSGKDVNFEDLFNEDFKRNFEYDYNLIMENYDVGKITFNHENIRELKNIISKNVWYNHFRKISSLDTWIDFETEIENVLNQISILIKYSEKSPPGQKYFRRKELNIYIDFAEFGFCQNQNMTISRFEEEFINVRTDKLDSKKILIKMAESLDMFISIFNSYLSNIVFHFYNSFKGIVRIPLQQIDFFYSFNYTPTLEKIYNKNILVTYLHGQANEDDSLQNIVLGINEITNEISINKVFEFSKDYQKIIKKTNTNLLELPTVKMQITEETIFYIFGHSLDKSDKEYIEHIFKFLELDHSESSRIVVFYHNSIDNKNKVKNLFSFINKNKVIEFNASERLDFVQINEKNIETEFSKKLWQKEFII